MTGPQSGSGGLRPHVIAIIVTVIGAIIAAALIAWLGLNGSGNGPTAVSPIPGPQTPSSTSPAGTGSISTSTESTRGNSPEATITASPPSKLGTSSSPPSETEYYLSYYNTVQTYGINVDATPRKVNGVTYYHPVAWYASVNASDPDWAEWDLSRKCTWFTSSGTGISDEAPSGSRYIFYVLTDGSDKWQETISLGQSYGVRVSIKGALRLRLSAGGLQNGYWGPYATWGDAKVSCYSEPPNRKE